MTCMTKMKRDAESLQPATSEAELTGTAAFDAGTGDMPAWGDLVAEHADGVYRLAYRLSGNQHDAEDLTQETFMRVFRSLDKYQAGTFEGWLHRITTNLFLDMVRHRSKIRMEALPEDYERVPGTDMTPEQAYSVANLDPALQSALDGLAPDFRVAVVLCDVVGMSYDEIAETLGVKMGYGALAHPPRPFPVTRGARKRGANQCGNAHAAAYALNFRETA